MYVIIEAIEVEKLAVPQTTYNFEVADFHTYYVSDCKILVHNRCTGKGFTKDQQAVIDLAKDAKKAGGISNQDANTLVGWAKEYGLNNHGIMKHPNRSGVWSFTDHIKIANMHIPIID